MTDLSAIADKLNLAVLRLQTFDRRAHEDAHKDIVEAAFWLSALLDEDPVLGSIGRALKQEGEGT